MYAIRSYYDINNTLLFTLYFYMWWLIPSLVITIFLFGNQILYLFGFNKGILKAFVFALICTFPMFLSSSVLGTLNYGLTIDEIFIKSIGPGLMEEFLFRGFLFGLLFYKNKCGFIPSALLGAITFGLLHLYQGNGVAHSAGVFLITAVITSYSIHYTKLYETSAAVSERAAKIPPV